MRAAFTLIEVLVTLILLSAVMAIVVPYGAKMLERFTGVLSNAEADVRQQLLRLDAFVRAENIDSTYEGKRYTYKPNGVVLIHE